MADPFLDYALPPLAADDPDQAFENLAGQLFSAQRVRRAMEARRFRQREAERYGSPLQQSPLQSGQVPAGQAADAQAERAGAPSVSRRQQSNESGSASAWERQRQRNRQAAINADSSRGALTTDPAFDPQAFGEWLRKDRSEEIMALPRQAGELYDRHIPELESILPPRDVTQMGPTELAVTGLANMAVGRGGAATSPAPLPAPATESRGAVVGAGRRTISACARGRLSVWRASATERWDSSDGGRRPTTAVAVICN